MSFSKIFNLGSDKVFTISTKKYTAYPKYLGAMQSAALNHASTVFRMRYYRNGSHAGFILYMSGNLDDNSLQNIRQQLEKSRGENNFKNMVVHSPNGKKGDIELIPIAEVGAKDEFLNIKNVTRDDILASHRATGYGTAQRRGLGMSAKQWSHSISWKLSL